MVTVALPRPSNVELMLLRRPPLRLGALALAATGLAMSLVGCGSSPPSEAQLVRSFKLAGMSSSEASCAADAIFTTLSDDQVAEIIQRGPSGAPYDDPASTSDDMDRVRAALDKCEAAAQPGTPGTSTTTSTIPLSTSTSTSTP